MELGIIRRAIVSSIVIRQLQRCYVPRNGGRRTTQNRYRG